MTIMTTKELLESDAAGERYFCELCITCDGSGLLIGADLSGADFTSSTFDVAEMYSVNLSHAILNRVDFGEVCFDNANLRSASMRHVLMREGCSVDKADLTGVCLAGSSLYALSAFFSNFQNANLVGVNLNSAGLSRANFQNSNLTGAMLVGASLKEANFTGATLDDVLFGDELSGDATFENTMMPDGSIRNS